MDVPDNLKYLWEYRQEEISHSRWLTTASGYLRLLIFELGNFGVDLKKKNRSKLPRILHAFTCLSI